MKKVLFLAVFLLLSACAQEIAVETPINTEFCGTSTQGACENDNDCVTDGCSGQVCRTVNEEAVFTTCEWLDCYEKNGIECKCVDNKCSWDSI
ncbi:eight-cysteine-cluster domain-containing protein [Candidatus Woesearchaeota archaeon]|nr:eight-cysteine-cluster domain-containing protein [Candidatus Woesearchaeota archaeon]